MFPGLHWMVLKTLLLFTSIYWVRWSLLRPVRSTMTLCWKWLVPISLLLVMAAAAFLRRWEASDGILAIPSAHSKPR